ncbi:MAG TPA: bifunctional 4-hydroxy-2-oxoglutarate aldolase/2-dehydro-3-deoxy-phosphogluconate aldolase [Alphaproteobacteria bacterium]|jgi:2-dehydro-3-deoxyphosphogluconate aldolase/(4S)-4-hydroxy-2-oxoglutarate aldolase|nr:bifunctional 4-hydroxy-2-oxoglutarate aldolase/2-dehydro-3-deoxy-phosphogluconate aldolase [Alphaproteobacteria bacterium]MDP7428485.1 bifunctional 4-hydroxy-2-oxoglutarate aldolase/2-dehydro-3-deoxy-phosphogluconate aldolase [Alphaproteobacteria bacterium]HJM52094.1 bifunctional 4-hydroxy-2-oxoglutarate aldolase/2-dehydro-3-deoxy-phosphogluconate aldolase [Alphaproteobacteria bacterium]
MTDRTTIEELLAPVAVVPVLTIENLSIAVPLGRALVAGGLTVLEVTLRSAAALAAVEAMVAAVPEAVVGVGTLTRPEEIAAARSAGARYAVSPGFDADLVAAAAEAGLPYLPGVATASEVQRARRLGLTTLKFFPAEPAGGSAALRAFAGPFPELRFCPTGGIDQSNAAEYLALDNVVCVGGSWPAPTELLAAGDWQAIEDRARQAAALGAHR